MTYKEAIENCLEVIEIEEGKELLPIAFTHFCVNFSLILLIYAEGLAKEDFMRVYREGEMLGGKGKEAPGIQDIVRILNGTDFSRHFCLSQGTHKFLQWLLGEEAEQEDLENMWYCLPTLAGKWNEFASEDSREDSTGNKK